MSRIGRLPIAVPAGVTVTIDKNNLVTVKGPLGELKQQVNPIITVKVEDGNVICTRPNDEKNTKAMHGLYRKLIANLVEGVTKGFEKQLVINGVGYKVAKQGNKIVMNIGFSHPVEFAEPDGIKFECPSITEISVKGISREQVGQTAANIRAIKIPDPYHAYGIRYKDEVIVRKEGKKASK